MLVGHGATARRVHRAPWRRPRLSLTVQRLRCRAARSQDRRTRSRARSHDPSRQHHDHDAEHPPRRACPGRAERRGAANGSPRGRRPWSCAAPARRPPCPHSAWPRSRPRNQRSAVAMSIATIGTAVRFRPSVLRIAAVVLPVNFVGSLSTMLSGPPAGPGAEIHPAGRAAAAAVLWASSTSLAPITPSRSRSYSARTPTWQRLLTSLLTHSASGAFKCHPARS